MSLNAVLSPEKKDLEKARGMVLTFLDGPYALSPIQAGNAHDLLAELGEAEWKMP